MTTFSRQEFVGRCGVEQETLTVWLEERWLIPGGTDAEPSFSEIDLARARLIRDLKEDLGVNEAGIGVILDLVDQVHGLRRALSHVQSAVKERGA